MKTIIREVKNHASVTHLENEGNYHERIGFWGIVTEINSYKNLVNVRSDNGFDILGIPVVSNEWVKLDGDYVTGERRLPTVNSRVFVLMPTKSVDSAFVLCSDFPRYEDNTGDFMAADESELESKNNSYERVNQSGWKETENYNNGNKTLTSKDGNITITVHPEEDSESGDSKEVKIVAWTNTVSITEDGITITDKNKNEVKIDSNGFSVGNQIGTLGKLMSDTLEQLIGLKTVGSPAAHTASPDFISQITAIKTKWDQIFK